MSDVDTMLEEAERNTETEIFNEAFADAPAPEAAAVEEPAAQTPAETPKADGRDPATGQFTAKEAPKEAQKVDPTATPDPKGDGQQRQDDGGQIPSWRLREEAEARRTAEKERDTLTSQLSQLQTRLAALEKPQAPPNQEAIDPLLDPDGFRKSMQDGFNAELQKINLNNNLAIAHVRHGETFEKAYEALLAEGQRGNRQLINQLTTSANPGESIVRWHKNQETLREVGGDPASYRNKVLEDALKDPAFLTKAVEAARAAADGQPQKKPNVQLPPSLSRATGSTQNSDPVDTDNSEEAVFSYAMNGR